MGLGPLFQSRRQSVTIAQLKILVRLEKIQVMMTCEISHTVESHRGCDCDFFKVTEFSFKKLVEWFIWTKQTMSTQKIISHALGFQDFKMSGFVDVEAFTDPI